jgi:hypothetical protein
MQLKNAPAITPRYWGAILAASMCGAIKAISCRIISVKG